MNNIFIISLLICLYQLALGQVAGSNAIFFESKGKWECPVARGKILSYNKFCEAPPQTGISFISDSAQVVYAVFDGEVVLVTHYDDVLLMVVRYGDYFIGYSNLSSAMVKKGDGIKTGQPIGNMGLNVDGQYGLDMQLSGIKNDLDILPWFNKQLQYQ